MKRKLSVNCARKQAIEMDICERCSSLLSGSSNPEWIQLIIRHYNEKWRHYHTLDHVRCMLNQMDTVIDKLEDTEAVTWAIIFHDIIYDPKSTDNEPKSAELFQSFARECLGHWTSDRVQKVVGWILATQSHSVDDRDCSDLLYFLDFDLQVLGWPELDYEKYTQQIRKEYSFVPEDTFNQKRSQILRAFLQWNRLYQTEEFYEKFEVQARENLSREISRLENTG